MLRTDWKEQILAPLSALQIADRRAKNCLINENIIYVGQLHALGRDGLLSLPRLGVKSFELIQKALVDFGMPLDEIHYAKTFSKFDPRKETLEDFLTNGAARHVRPVETVSSPLKAFGAKYVLAAMPKSWHQISDGAFALAAADYVLKDEHVMTRVTQLTDVIADSFYREVESLNAGTVSKSHNSKPMLPGHLQKIWEKKEVIMSFIPEASTRDMSAQFQDAVSDALLRNANVQRAINNLDFSIRSVLQNGF